MVMQIPHECALLVQTLDSIYVFASLGHTSLSEDKRDVSVLTRGELCE